MNIVLGVFIVIAIVLFVVELFSPKASLFWYKRKRTRWLSALIYLVVIISLSCISASLEVGEEITETNNRESKEEPVPNFYTFPEANQWTPAKPENKLIEFIGYLKANDWKKMETICRKGYDSNDLESIFFPYTDLKGFRIDKINEAKYKSDIQITLCYCLDKDTTKQFEVTLLRVNKDDNPDINASWLVDPIFQMR